MKTFFERWFGKEGKSAVERKREAEWDRRKRFLKVLYPGIKQIVESDGLPLKGVDLFPIDGVMVYTHGFFIKAEDIEENYYKDETGAALVAYIKNRHRECSK